MNDIQKLWHHCQQLSFPNELADKAIDGIDLARIDRCATECISAFVDNDGRIDDEQTEILKRCMAQMRQVNPNLVGEGQVYFGMLYRLCDLISRNLPEAS